MNVELNTWDLVAVAAGTGSDASPDAGGMQPPSRVHLGVHTFTGLADLPDAAVRAALDFMDSMDFAGPDQPKPEGWAFHASLRVMRRAHSLAPLDPVWSQEVWTAETGATGLDTSIHIPYFRYIAIPEVASGRPLPVWQTMHSEERAGDAIPNWVRPGSRARLVQFNWVDLHAGRVAFVEHEVPGLTDGRDTALPTDAQAQPREPL